MPYQIYNFYAIIIVEKSIKGGCGGKDMKKFQVLVVSILFLSNVNIYAYPSSSSSPDPYQGMAVGQPVSVFMAYDTVVNKMSNSILPNRPICSTDSSGARSYFSPTGRQLFSVSKDGQTTMTVGKVTTTRDKEGNVISVTERKKGTNILEVKDSFGEIIAYKTVGANGLTDKEFDKDFNLTKSYNYDKFNKTVTSVVNEVTQEMTLFDRFGREKGVISIGFGGDGYVISTNQYDDVSYERSEDGKSIIEITNPDKKADAKLLVTKKTYNITIDGAKSDGTVDVSSGYNTIYYDREGLISKVVDNNGITISEYFYKRDNYGNKVLTHVLNPKDKSVTYYENGKPVEERNDVGGLTKKYYYDGSRLLYTVSMGSDGSFGDVTYYDNTGRAMSTVHKFVQYDPSSSNRIDFVCGSEYSKKLSEAEVNEIKAKTSSLVKDRDYIIKMEKNPETMQDEAVYYFVPDGIEGVNYIKKEVKDDEGKTEIKFYMISEKYVYDKKGNIDYVINLTDNTRTYYKNNKMYYVAANDDSTKGIRVSDNPNDPRLLKIFSWDINLDFDTNNEASVLRYVFDVKTQTTQWFNADSQFVYLTYNDRLVSSNIYDGAKLVGTWNNQTKELTILRDEKQWITINLDFEPDVSFIRKILSFTNADAVDWDSISNYINYYCFRETLLKDDFNLIKMVDTFDKYNKLKKDSAKELAGTQYSLLDYLRYIDTKKSNSNINNFKEYLSYKNFNNIIKKLYEENILSSEILDEFSSLSYKEIIDKYSKILLDFGGNSSLAISLVDYLNSEEGEKNIMMLIDYLKQQ